MKIEFLLLLGTLQGEDSRFLLDLCKFLTSASLSLVIGSSQALSIVQEQEATSKMPYNLGSFHTATAAERAKKPGVLSWRLPQEESFSDWTIEIEATENEGGQTNPVSVVTPPSSKKTRSSKRRKVASGSSVDKSFLTTYHVHKAILGVGARCSDYFVNLFLTNSMEESVNQKSHIALDKVAAKSMPVMLDFMYGKAIVVSDPVEAVALRHLSTYFAIGELFETVNETFIQKNLSIETAFIYMQEASKYQDDALLDAAITCVAENIDESCEVVKPEILRMPVDWFGKMLEKCPEISDEVLDITIAYIKEKPEGLNSKNVADWLERVTYVDSAQCLSLLHIAVDHKMDLSLKEKCASEYSSQWSQLLSSDASKSSNGSNDACYGSLPDSEKVLVLEAALRRAGSDFKACEQLNMDMNSRIGHINSRLSATTTRATQAEARARESKDTLAKFERVPITHDFTPGVTAAARSYQYSYRDVNKLNQERGFDGQNLARKPLYMPPGLGGFPFGTATALEGYSFRSTTAEGTTVELPVFIYNAYK